MAVQHAVAAAQLAEQSLLAGGPGTASRELQDDTTLQETEAVVSEMGMPVPGAGNGRQLQCHDWDEEDDAALELQGLVMELNADAAAAEQQSGQDGDARSSSSKQDGSDAADDDEGNQ